MAEKVVIGNAELWHGDCREVLPLLPRFDAVITDPPYGISKAWKGGFGHGWGRARADAGLRNEWDAEVPSDDLLQQVLAAGDEIVIWGGNYFNLPPSRCWWVWSKPERGFSLAEAELAWTNRDNVVRVFDGPRSDVGREHPTQKPVALMAWCLQKIKGRTVVDPFMGSGTTGVACAQLGKAFTGIERERKYFDIACERISRAQAQGTLLPPEPSTEMVQEGLL